MRRKKVHYYPKNRPDSSRETACKRDGSKTGGLIDFFFKSILKSKRCKTCDKIFEKDQKI